MSDFFKRFFKNENHSNGNTINNFEVSTDSGTTVTINGKTYSGNHIQMNGNKVVVDGERVNDIEEKEITITVDGDVKSISLGSGHIKAKNIGSLRVGSGDVDCEEVNGDITTGSGDVDCQNVTGSIKTGSGDVSAIGDIGGSVQTASGDVKSSIIQGPVTTVSGNIYKRDY